MEDIKTFTAVTCDGPEAANLALYRIPVEWGHNPPGTKATLAKAKEILLCLRADVAEEEARVLQRQVVDERQRRDALSQRLDLEHLQNVAMARAIAEERALNASLHETVLRVTAERDTLARRLASAKARAKRTR